MEHRDTTALTAEILDSVRDQIHALGYILENDRPCRMTATEARHHVDAALAERFDGAALDDAVHIDVRSLRRTIAVRGIAGQPREQLERLWDGMGANGADLAADAIATVIGWSDSLGLVIAIVQDSRGYGLTLVARPDGEWPPFGVTALDSSSTSVKITPYAPADVRIVESGNDFAIINTGRHLYSVPNTIANALARAKRHQRSNDLA